MAKEMAFMNSVTLGTRANSVKPNSFSSIDDTASTLSTRISVVTKEMLLLLVMPYIEKFEANGKHRTCPKTWKGRTCDDGVEDGAAKKYGCTLGLGPVG